jgi:hypothetical protein
MRLAKHRKDVNIPALMVGGAADSQVSARSPIGNRQILVEPIGADRLLVNTECFHTMRSKAPTTGSVVRCFGGLPW